MSHFDSLSAGRQKTVTAAVAGCWDGTRELVSAIVRESRGHEAWKPVRTSAEAGLASSEGPFMFWDEFAAWRKDAKMLQRGRKLPEHPREALGYTKSRYEYLGSEARTKKHGVIITKIEALSCAHYIMGYPMPCEPEGLPDWFWPRFGNYASIAAALDVGPAEVSARINGGRVVDNQRVAVTPEPTFIRALDWVWRNGPSSPYGVQPVVRFTTTPEA